jgi:hypothetical protein
MNRISILFAIAALGFGGLFIADLRGFFTVTQKPVAVLKGAAGTVKRLPHDELTWDRAQEGSVFGAGDTLATGEQGSASLVFYAGGELDLDSGAMVVLSGSPEELKLNFVSGMGQVRVTRAASKKIQIAAPQTGQRSQPRVRVAVVEKLAPVLAKASPPKPKLAPAIREDKIRDPSRTLAAVTPKGELLNRIELPPVPEIRSPGPDAIVDLSDGKIDRLQWDIPHGAEIASYEVVLRPATGDGPAQVLKTDRKELALTQIKGGKWLWSVRAVSPKGARSPASTSRWLEVRVPAQISKPRILPVRVE